MVSDIDSEVGVERLLKALERVESMEGIPFVGIHSATGRPEDVNAALEGIFRLREERFELRPPVDWWAEPYRAAGERGFFQNSFVFADPLLADPRFPDVLDPLAAIFVDWLEANPQSGASHPHRYAWHDHAAAGRLVTMAYVLREGLRRRALSRLQVQRLAAGVIEHAEYLLADENYAAQNNHGLASDAALALAARSLDPAPQAIDWSAAAEGRFGAVVDHTIDKEDGLHLEHSPYYHWIVRGALARFADAGLFEDLDLKALIQRMGESGAWLIAPDGTLPPLGDTPLGRRPPAQAIASAESLSGMRTFHTAGYAVVRDGGNALFVTAAHHPTAHKHADDGSFCLYEGGRAVVLDAGDPGYDYDSREFRYGTSPAAHATICVDGFNWARGAPAYGSGIVATAERDGIYTILVRNPVATRGGGSARRVLTYAPGRFLLVLDKVEAGPECELIRNIPIAPELMAAIMPGGGVEILDADRVVAQLVQVTGAEAPLDQVELIRGQLEPAMGGFCFPTPDTSEPRYDIRFRGPAGHPRALALILGDMALTGGAEPDVSWRERDNQVDVELSGLTASPLCIRFGESSIGLA